MPDFSTGDHPAESVAVQLTRIEGVVNRVFDRVDDLRTRVTSLETDNVRNTSAIQRLDEQATAEANKRDALAAALKEADETRQKKSDAAWSPVARFYAFLTTVAVVGTFIYYLVKHPA